MQRSPITINAISGASLMTAASFNNEIYTNFITNEVKYAEAIKINNKSVKFITFTAKGNVFMSTNNGLYYLTYENKKTQKILRINELVNISKFHKNATYFGTNLGAYVLKNGETTAQKLNEIVGENIINSSRKKMTFISLGKMIEFIV